MMLVDRRGGAGSRGACGGDDDDYDNESAGDLIGGQGQQGLGADARGDVGVIV